MNENKPTLPFHVILFSILIVLILGSLLGKIVFGETETTKIMPIIVKGEHYEWTWEDEVLKIVNTHETPKEAIVADIKHVEIKGPKYTTRVGLQGSRKPIYTLNGLTTQERAKEWLEKAGLGYTLPTWIELGEKHKIDYTLPICIAWADSHLGKALKSRNNIGNVGNNDRGDVKHYDTLEQGIGAIFRTLNNKYQINNRKVGELSGEGRTRLGVEGCIGKGHYCYATSKGVWSTNVTNCMSAIHDKKIDENYQFRLQ